MLDVIEKFKDEFGYITDIEKVIVYLKTCNKTTEEIMDCLILVNEYNLKVYKNIDEDNKLQQRISKLNTSISLAEEETKSNLKTNISQNEEKSINKVDISYYIALIDELRKNNFSKNDILNILPSREDPDFYSKINTILLHYKKELLELLSLKNKSDLEFVEYIETEKEMLNLLNETIIDYRDFKEVENKTTQKYNILFDFSTCEADIDVISSEHYYDFYILFSDLSKNVLRGVKTFTPVGGNKAVSEVRYNGARILFDKIDNETYFVYYIFPKKATDKYYHEKLVNRVNNYASKKKSLLAEFYNPLTKKEIIKENEIYFNNVINKLCGKKSKVGDDSGEIKTKIK